MIEREHDLLIDRQAKVLHISRAGLLPLRPVPDAALAIMRPHHDGHHLHPMAGNFVYLAVVLVTGSSPRAVVAAVDYDGTEFCVATLEDYLAGHGKPDIFNTDQGSQFTRQAFTGVLATDLTEILVQAR
jgi:hypothetical protein